MNLPKNREIKLVIVEKKVFIFIIIFGNNKIRIEKEDFFMNKSV